MKNTDNNKSEKTLTECMENVLCSIKNQGLKPECLESVRNDLDYLNQSLGTTDLQTILFLVILEDSFESLSSIRSVTRILHISNIRFLGMKKDLDTLVSKRLISERKTHSDDISYKVPINTVKAVQQGKVPGNDDISNLTQEQIFMNIFNVFRSLHSNEITPMAAYQEIHNMMVCNKETSPFVQKMFGLGIPQMSRQEQLITFYVLHRYESFREYHFTDSDFNHLILSENGSNTKAFKNLDNGSSPLFKNSILEFRNDAGQIDNTVYVLTDKIRNDLMKDTVPSDKEMQMMRCQIPSDEHICAANIEERSLYYNEEETQEIDRLERLLSRDNLERIQARLQERGMSKGFTALFYGAPGTGKTASIFELARRSGRDLYLVDPSKLRSKWHGESEKLLKSLFTNYRRMVENSKNCPILVFNECDSIMNKRSEGTDSVFGLMNNELVNIILNELDDFPGILLATSNLPAGIDPAFERRLLFKVNFKKPSLSVREKIWASKIDSLLPDELYRIAEKYDFSGGQIDNIARKANIDYVLTGKLPTFETIVSYCDREEIRSAKIRKHKIGF